MRRTDPNETTPIAMPNWEDSDELTFRLLSALYEAQWRAYPTGDDGRARVVSNDGSRSMTLAVVDMDAPVLRVAPILAGMQVPFRVAIEHIRGES